MHKFFAALLVACLLLSGCSQTIIESSGDQGFSEDSAQSSVPFFDLQTVSQKLPFFEKTVNMQVQNSAYQVLNAAFDPTTETYALLYTTPKDLYNNSSLLQIQLFDAQGDFLKKIQIDLKHGPTTPKNGYFTFYAGTLYFPVQQSNHTMFVSLNSESGRYISIQGEQFVWEKDYLVSLQTIYDEVIGFSQSVFSLYHGQNLAGVYAVPDADYFSYWSSWEEPSALDIEQGRRKMSLTFDADELVITLTDSKKFLTIDCKKASYSERYVYTEEMLEDFLASTPDGKYDIYRADVVGAGEGIGGEFVRVDQDKNIVFLDCFHEHINQYAFGPNAQVLFNHISFLTLVDYEKPEILEKRFGSVPYHEKRFLDVVYDAEANWYLAASRPQFDQGGPFETQMPITLDVFSPDGTLIKSIETGLSINVLTGNGFSSMPS